LRLTSVAISTSSMPANGARKNQFRIARDDSKTSIVDISCRRLIAMATFRTSSKGQRPDHQIGGWEVIEPPRPLVRQCGPHGLSHHAAINDKLMRNGGSLTFARYLLDNGTRRSRLILANGARDCHSAKLSLQLCRKISVVRGLGNGSRAF
jgi:hypothetical protein